jgi:hypothetical protein
MEFLLLDIADLFFQSSYRILCLTVKNHVVEKMGPCFFMCFQHLFTQGDVEYKKIQNHL